MLQLEDILCMYGVYRICTIPGIKHNTFVGLLRCVNKEIRAVCGPRLGLCFPQPPCWLSASNYLVSGQIKYSNSPRKQTQISGGNDGQSKKKRGGGDINQHVCPANGLQKPISVWQSCKHWLAGWATKQPHTFQHFCFACNRPRTGGFGLVKVSCFPYRQVGIVTVTVVHGSYDTGPPRPPVYVADFWRLVPADTEEPLPDQLRPSLDCHGPSAGPKTPPLEKTSQPTAPSKPRYLRH